MPPRQGRITLQARRGVDGGPTSRHRDPAGLPGPMELETYVVPLYVGGLAPEGPSLPPVGAMRLT
jgi:hypothetical protein